MRLASWVCFNFNILCHYIHCCTEPLARVLEDCKLLSAEGFAHLSPLAMLHADHLADRFAMKFCD